METRVACTAIVLHALMLFGQLAVDTSASAAGAHCAGEKVAIVASAAVVVLVRDACAARAPLAQLPAYGEQLLPDM